MFTLIMTALLACTPEKEAEPATTPVATPVVAETTPVATETAPVVESTTAPTETVAPATPATTTTSAK